MIRAYKIVDIVKNAVILCCIYRIIWFWLFPIPEMPIRYAVLLQLAGFALPIAALCLLQLIFRLYIQRKGGVPERLPQRRRLLYSLLLSVVITALGAKPLLWLSMHIFQAVTNSQVSNGQYMIWKLSLLHTNLEDHNVHYYCSKFCVPSASFGRQNGRQMAVCL